MSELRKAHNIILSERVSINFTQQWGIYLSYCVDEWHNREVLVATTRDEIDAKAIADLIEKGEIKGWYNTPSKVSIRQDILAQIK